MQISLFILTAFLLLIGFQINIPSSAFAEITTQPVDSDGDGVSDSKETQDGTDPNSVDSFIEHVNNSYCVDWNGFLSDEMQVMELRNSGCSTLNIKVSLRDSTGALQDTFSHTLAPTKQFDLVANSLNGFGPMSYGTLCASIQSGDSDTLDVRMSTYSLSGNTFSRAFSSPSSPARTGAQFVNYNNFFPTANPSQFSNHVEGWVQVSNDESTSQTGSLVYYDIDGSEVKQTAITIGARGRFDADTHSLGENTVGLIKWIPDNSSKKFRLALNRYYFSGSLGSNLAGIVSIPARRPSGYLVAAAFQTDSRIAVLELSNSRDINVTISLSVFNSEGSLTDTQPGSITLGAHETIHVILNNYLASGLGKVQFSANRSRSIISSLFEYGLDSTLQFSFANVTEAKAGFGLTQQSSYNNFLGDCRLRLANLTNSKRSTAVDLNRSDGTTVTFSSPVQVPANATVELNLCSSDEQNNYGGVILTPNSAETLIGEVIRENSDSSTEFKTAASERSICAARLSLNTASLSLIAESANPGTVSITNSSTAVTATNIQASLPTGWNDVTVDDSNCENLAPGDSCIVSFTPGNSSHTAASVSIAGDNTSELLPTISVTANPTATISVAGSPLLLTANGATDTLTITNTSTSATALNVTSSFAATALDGNVTESANTCASLSPLASCALTFTPGNSVVGATAFSIQGSNTNSLTASIQIQSGSSLSSIASNSGTASGGTGVTLTGTGLTGTTAVTFDGVAATSVNVVNATTVTAVTPSHAAGVVDVVISSPAGGATLVNGFTYVATAVGQSAFGGTIGCINGGLANLISSTADNSGFVADGSFGTVTNAQSNTDGATNTATIVGTIGGGGYGAKVCSDYEIDSQGNTPCQAGNSCYNDWFLPAKDQLNCLYVNNVAIGGFIATNYLNSTESAGSPAANSWQQLFTDGTQIESDKRVNGRVRCTRAFVP